MNFEAICSHATKKLSGLEVLQGMVRLLWHDGLEFFNHDTFRLTRVDGFPVTCMSRLKSCGWLFWTLLTATIYLWIVLMQMSKHGDLKLQRD